MATSKELFNPNIPLNGFVKNGEHITQSMAYYEALAREDFARFEAENLKRNNEIREIFQNLRAPER